MPYQLFQGGRLRRRRRRTGLLRLLAVAIVAVAAFAFLRDRPHHHRRAVARRSAPVPTIPAPLQDSGTAPLAGGGTAPSPLAVRLQDPRDLVSIRLKHPPRSGLLFDLDTGRVLWRRDPTRVLPIASLTKMMTALVVADRVARGSRVLITKQALAYTGSGVGVLPRGRWIPVKTMLYGLLLPSGNDAAIALAQRAAGTVGRFVDLMNKRARAMGLVCTHFTSPSGIVDQGNHSCAGDLAALARAVLREPRLAPIVRARHAVFRFPIKGHKLYLYNNNPLLMAGYPGTTGVKTGYTDAAGRCLVASAQRGPIRLGVVLLHSPDPGGQARRLLDRGFRAERAAA
jgi:serine-type D-Ala-D-Ala carboxypeptidase (penicillin-binding protein 5/6)